MRPKAQFLVAPIPPNLKPAELLFCGFFRLWMQEFVGFRYSTVS